MVVLQYVTETEEFKVITEKIKEKRPSSPKPVDVPYSSDTVVEEDGEEEEVMEFSEEDKDKDVPFLAKAEEYLIAFESTVP